LAVDLQLGQLAPFLPYDNNGKYYRKPVYKVVKTKKALPKKKLFRRGCIFGCIGFTASLLIVGFLMILGYLYEGITDFEEWLNQKSEPLPLYAPKQNLNRQSLIPLGLVFFHHAGEDTIGNMKT